MVKKYEFTETEIELLRTKMLALFSSSVVECYDCFKNDNDITETFSNVIDSIDTLFAQFVGEYNTEYDDAEED